MVASTEQQTLELAVGVGAVASGSFGSISSFGSAFSFQLGQGRGQDFGTAIQAGHSGTGIAVLFQLITEGLTFGVGSFQGFSSFGLTFSFFGLTVGFEFGFIDSNFSGSNKIVALLLDVVIVLRADFADVVDGSIELKEQFVNGFHGRFGGRLSGLSRFGGFGGFGRHG